MGRHLMRALTQDGLEEGSQSTKYTQVALKKGTSLGPSLFTWKTQDKGNNEISKAQKPTLGLRGSTLNPNIYLKNNLYSVCHPKQEGHRVTQLSTCRSE